MLTQVKTAVLNKKFHFDYIKKKTSSMFGMDNMIPELLANKLEETLAVI
jgi:hypothetical protein